MLRLGAGMLAADAVAARTASDGSEKCMVTSVCCCCCCVRMAVVQGDTVGLVMYGASFSLVRKTKRNKKQETREITDSGMTCKETNTSWAKELFMTRRASSNHKPPCNEVPLPVAFQRSPRVLIGRLRCLD